MTEADGKTLAMAWEEDGQAISVSGILDRQSLLAIANGLAPYKEPLILFERMQGRSIHHKAIRRETLTVDASAYQLIASRRTKPLSKSYRTSRGKANWPKLQKT